MADRDYGVPALMTRTCPLSYLPDDYNFLDNENERPRLRLSDDQVWQEIIKLAGVTCSSDFQKLERQLQRETLGQLRELGASVRQLERLTGISRGIIQFV